MIFLIYMAAMFTTVYALMIASTAWQDLLTGLILSIILMAIFRRVALPGGGIPSNRSTIRVTLAAPRYAWMMARDILMGTCAVALCVVGLRPIRRPGIIRVPIGDHTPAGVGMAGLCLTLSPGSYLVDVDWGERVMLVHVIDATDWQEVHDDMLEYFTLLDAALNPDSQHSYPEMPGGGGGR
ncbi:MAG: Na+/H+ antiporter subunit E [Thermomicrobiales bacterium]